MLVILSWQIILTLGPEKMLLSGSLVSFIFKESTTLGVVLGDSEKSKQMYRVLYDNKVGHFFEKQLEPIEGD